MQKHSRIFLILAVAFVLVGTSGCFHRGDETSPKKNGTNSNGAYGEDGIETGNEQTSDNGSDVNTSEPADPAALNAVLEEAEEDEGAFNDANSAGSSVQDGGKTL